MIEEMIAKKLKIDVSEVTDDKHLIDDLGADSLDTVELVMEPDLDRIARAENFVEDGKLDVRRD